MVYGRMSTQKWLEAVKTKRVIAVIRAQEFELGVQMARAAAQGGMGLIEITWNSDRVLDLIPKLKLELPHCSIGTGTILTIAQLEQAMAVGAEFCFSPHTHPPLIQAAARRGVPIIPGGLSPTEIVTAWQAGATAVKVFPVQAVGGAGYIQSLQGPLGKIPLIPTGGVTLDNAGTFLKAGAIAIGLSSQLFPQAAIAAQEWSQITQRCQQFLASLAEKGV